jgi:hypothetical protein
VKLGSENRKQIIALAVLGGILLLSVGYELWPSSTGASAPVSGTPASGKPSKPLMRKNAAGKLIPVVEPRLDPTLDLTLLAQSEGIKYGGNGRNIFVPGSVPTIKASHNGTTDHDKGPYIPPQPPPPPPILLKFFGFANKPGEAKRVFLSQNEDVWIAGEGEIVNRRYRVIRIMPNAVEIEDVLNNNRQSIPLTQS